MTELNNLARDMVGDGKSPDVFFVTERGNVILITTKFDLAYAAWQELAERRIVSSLENRTYGFICAAPALTLTRSLRLVVVGHPPRDEVRAKWELVNPGARIAKQMFELPAGRPYLVTLDPQYIKPGTPDAWPECAIGGGIMRQAYSAGDAVQTVSSMLGISAWMLTADPAREGAD